MKANKRTISALWLLLCLALCVPAGAQGPKVLIDTNQMTAAEAHLAARLKGGDGSWMLTYNSPGFTRNLWQYVTAQIGSGTVVSEDGSIGTSWVLNFLFAPRVVLLDSTGHFVSAHSGDGGSVAANVSYPYNTPDETFAYYTFTPFGPPNPGAVSFGKLWTDKSDYFLKSFSNLWVKAPGGGGQSLISTSAPAEYWDVFRIYKLGGGDKIIRPFDTVAIQSNNGIPNGTLQGKNLLVSNQNQGGALIPNGSTVTPAATFQVIYPNEFLTTAQIAPVTNAMVYTEFNDTVPKQPDGSWTRDWTLSNTLLNQVASRMGRGGIVVLSRTFQDISQYPGVLPTHKQQVLTALANPNCGGVVFELQAGLSFAAGNILNFDSKGNESGAIDAICSRGKKCYLLLPPANNSANYSRDVLTSLDQLKKSKWYRKLILVLACYDRQKSNVTFLGGVNSVEGALQLVLTHR